MRRLSLTPRFSGVNYRRMIFAYLIVPAVCANLLAESLRNKLIIGWLTATIASIAGLYVSYSHDLPTGASIVGTLGAALLLVGAAARFFRKPAQSSGLSGPQMDTDKHR